MKTRISTTIEAGDLVEHRGEIHMAVPMIAGRTCSEQCSMHDPDKGRCNGYCFRWVDADGIVFRYVLPMEAVARDTVVTATPDLIGERILNGASPQKRSYYKKKAENEKRKPGPKPKKRR